MFPILASLAATITLVAAAASPADEAALVASLITANSQVNRVADVTPNSAYVFDFTAGPRGNAQGGFAVSANSGNFPALLTGNGAMTVGVLGPCGANSPHTHPRATEIQIVVSGGSLYTEFIMENGANVVNNTVPLGSATIFPKGSIHFQQNMACEPTVFIASFDSVDPGTSQIAQNFFKLNQGVVEATLGDIGVSVLDAMKLPENIILGAQECLDRCGIDRSTFNFTATFGDYAIFSNSTWNANPSLPPAVTSLYSAIYGSATSTPSSSTANKNLAQLSGGASSSTDIPFDRNPLHTTVIGLAAAAGVLFIAVVSMAVMLARRRSHVPVSGQFHDEPVYTHYRPGSESKGSRTMYNGPYDGSRQSMINA